MSLLREIQREAVDSASDVAGALRKAKMLSARLGYGPLADWADRELRGYRDAADVPAYRKQPLAFRGDFQGFSMRITNVEVQPAHFPPEVRDVVDKLLTASVGESVAELSELLRTPDGSFRLSVPVGLAARLHHRVYSNMGCTALWLELQRTQVVHILDAVRDSLLNFSLDVERRFPALGEKDTVTDDKKEQKLAEAFQLHIAGTGNTVNVGNRDVHQKIDVTETKGNVQHLVDELRRAGVSEVDIVELKDILVEEQAAPTGKLPPRTAGWLGKLVAKSATGAWGVGVETAGGLLTKILGAFFGLPG